MSLLYPPDNGREHIEAIQRRFTAATVRPSFVETVPRRTEM